MFIRFLCGIHAKYIHFYPFRECSFFLMHVSVCERRYVSCYTLACCMAQEYTRSSIPTIVNVKKKELSAVIGCHASSKNTSGHYERIKNYRKIVFGLPLTTHRNSKEIISLLDTKYWITTIGSLLLQRNAIIISARKCLRNSRRTGSWFTLRGLKKMKRMPRKWSSFPLEKGRKKGKEIEKLHN